MAKKTAVEISDEVVASVASFGETVVPAEPETQMAAEPLVTAAEPVQSLSLSKNALEAISKLPFIFGWGPVTYRNAVAAVKAQGADEFRAVMRAWTEYIVAGAAK